MSEKPHLLILIGGHLSLGPRPQKEAAAAVAAGFKVSMRGNWWDTRLADEDLMLAKEIGIDFAPLLDLRGGSGLLLRLKQRAAREWFRRTGIATSRSFGNGAPEMLREANRLQPDLVMVHSEAGLWAGNQLLKRGFRVGVDFEDWFSEDLPEADRADRPVQALKKLENTLLRKASPQFATTSVMARALALAAGTAVPPLTLPNAFPWSKAPAHVDTKAPLKLYWFSQTIGPKRGLEELAIALEGLTGDWELHLLGALRSYQNWLETTFAKTRNHLQIHDPVSNFELPGVSAQFDLGLALEIPHYPNRDLTATNKIFEYLRCGLGVIATDTRGQKEIMTRCPEAGELVPASNPAALTVAIQKYIDSPSALDATRKAASHAAQHTWDWEQFSTIAGNALKRAATSQA